jgi:hypothetical protein
MKTVEQHFYTIADDEIRSEALKEAARDGQLNMEYDNLAEAIINGFIWHEADKPTSYWSKVHSDACAGILELRKQPTQKDQVKLHLKAHGKITQMDALKLYGCFRLADVIFKLRNEGMMIDTTYPEEGKRYAIYIYKS